MTDNNVEIFRGRDARAETIDRLAHPSYGAGAIASADLEGQFRIATAIANATEAVPRGYRKQPGAVLLALAWSQAHGVDVLTAIQNVAFVEGKAVVDATMQRALAKRAGYDLSITVELERATVGVMQSGKRLGEASYSMVDAEAAGLTGKRNWQHNREDMLVARATTRAVRRFAPDVLLGMLVSDEVDDPPDIAEVVELEAPDAGQLTLEDVPKTADATVAATTEDATGGNDPAGMGPAGSDLPWATADDMRADLKARGIKTADVIREAQELAKAQGVATPAGTLDAVWRHPDPVFQRALWAWVVNHDEGE